MILMVFIFIQENIRGFLTGNTELKVSKQGDDCLFAIDFDPYLNNICDHTYFLHHLYCKQFDGKK